MKKILSKRFTLNQQDLLKGLLIAVLTPAVFVIQEAISKGDFNLNWKMIGLTSASAGLAYLIKNFLAPTSITTIKPTDSEVQSVENK